MEMTLNALMETVTGNPDFAGVITTDDYALAIDVSENGDAEPGDYAVAQYGIIGVDAQLSAETKDSNYIRQGKTTTKVATQRTFNITGDEYVSDLFQDFVLSHKIKYGIGQDVIRSYIRINMKTLKGEKGKASIVVNADGSGEAGSTAEIDIDIMAVGTPKEYTWEASGEEISGDDV